MVDQRSSPMPGLLRSPRTRLFGRETEVADVRRFLLEGASSPLTLTGPGGVGKTQLALRVAHELAPHFADGAVFVSLASVTDDAFVPSAIAHAIDVHESRDESIVERLAAALRDRHLLLVLDNFEHLLPAGTVVADLLARCPALTILVTSRIPLGVAGEQRFPVPTLTVPEPAAIRSAADAGQCAAVQLFVARARAARPSFDLSDGNHGIVAEICRHLDGLPLAIELAAARIAVLSPRALLDRLDRRLPLLTDGPRDAPPRLRTMRDTIAWSYDLLMPEEQALFRALSLFVGGFTLEAAEAIAGAAGIQQSDTLDRLTALVCSSLVQPLETPDDQPRYQMLETVREFGLDRLVDAGEERVLREAHRDWFLSFVERICSFTHGPGATVWLDRVTLEHANLRAALTWALARGDANTALRMSSALLDYWFFRGHIREGHRWLAESLTIGDDAPVPLRAQALHGLGSFASRLGEREQALAVLENCLALYRALGDRHRTGEVLTVLGRIAEDEGDYSRAERFLIEAHSCFEALGDVHCISQTLYHLGIVAQGQGDLDLAMVRYEAAQGPARETNDYFHVATTLWYQGHVHCLRGELAQAADALEEAIEMERALGHVEGAAPNFATMAMLAEAVGMPDAAARIMGTAASVMIRQGLSIGLPERIDYDEVQDRVRDQLGEAAFDEAWQIGMVRTIAESTDDVTVILAAARSHLSPKLLPEGGVELGAFHQPLPRGVATTVAAKDFGLTQRQQEILILLCQRLTDREIAERLFLSARTVEGHVTQILGKFGVANRREAAAFAARHDLVDSRLIPAS